MKILSLNCRGLGQPEAIQELRCLIQLHRPWFVFLSETWLFFDNVYVLKRSLGLANGLGWKVLEEEVVWCSCGHATLL